MRVLEIGTGYNAALLAHRLGTHNVTSIEIETAYHWWRDAGRPGSQRWRITITPEGQQITLQASSPAGAARH